MVAHKVSRRTNCTDHRGDNPSAHTGRRLPFYFIGEACIPRVLLSGSSSMIKKGPSGCNILKYPLKWMGWDACWSTFPRGLLNPGLANIQESREKNKQLQSYPVYALVIKGFILLLILGKSMESIYGLYYTLNFLIFGLTFSSYWPLISVVLFPNHKNAILKILSAFTQGNQLGCSPEKYLGEGHASWLCREQFR